MIRKIVLPWSSPQGFSRRARPPRPATAAASVPTVASTVGAGRTSATARRPAVPCTAGSALGVGAAPAGTPATVTAGIAGAALGMRAGTIAGETSASRACLPRPPTIPRAPRFRGTSTGEDIPMAPPDRSTGAKTARNLRSRDAAPAPKSCRHAGRVRNLAHSRRIGRRAQRPLDSATRPRPRLRSRLPGPRRPAPVRVVPFGLAAALRSAAGGLHRSGSGVGDRTPRATGLGRFTGKALKLHRAR
jgi:hypothetical protein